MQSTTIRLPRPDTLCPCGHSMAGHSNKPFIDGTVGCFCKVGSGRCPCMVTGRSRAQIEADAVIFVGLDRKLAELRAEWLLAPC